MRRLTAIAALALIVASPAAAKELTGVELCGAGGCTEFDVPAGTHQYPGAAATAPPPPAGPFFEVVLEFDGLHTERLWYVPGARLFAVPDGAGWIRWVAPAGQTLDRMIVDAAAAPLQPYRARVTAAHVDGRRVRGGVAGYLTLFAVGADGEGRDRGDDFASVSLTTKPISPWALTRLWFYPESGLLQRGAAETVLLPRDVAADLRAARAIGPTVSDGGFDWPLVTGSLVIALALALGAAALARRRPGFATFL